MFNINRLVGMDVNEAIELLAEEAMSLFVVEENGIANFPPKGYNPDQVKVVLRSEKIVEVRGKG